MKPTLLSLMTISLTLSAAMAGETGPASGAPAGDNGQPPYSWRGINGSGVFPAQGLVTSFKGGADGKGLNIIWRTALPNWGGNAPIAVKDRVFVMCQEGVDIECPQLFCLDVKDGKILWQQPVDHLDAWPADKAKVAKETRAKHLRYWREYMTWWNKLYWDNEKNTWRKGVAHPKGKPPEVIPPEQAALAAEAAKAGFNLPPTAGIGVSGGWRGRYYWGSGTKEMQQTFDACTKNRYHWYSGWSSEGPFFGSCMGSVVSDGNRIYAVTALDGAACFDLDGKRLWVADLEGKQLIGYPASASHIHNSMASPVLAGGKLIYYHYGAVEFIALDAQTGRLAWRTPGPIKAGKPGAHQVAGIPIGYEGGHMTPGGTPVVMVLGGTPVVVSGHGMVCRIADGKFLGQVGFPAELAKTSKSGEEGLVYASSYSSWVAHGDTLYAVALDRLIVVRLGLKGDALTQEVAWNLDAMDIRNPNPVVLGQTVYLYQGKQGASVKALDAATGKILASGPDIANYTTNLGFTRDLAVWKGRTKPNSGDAVTYNMVGVPDLKLKGNGYLWPEKPFGEIAERHIAALGKPRLTLSNSGLSCWGNRIFIRDNDYLWCIGDPAKPFVPPEAVSKAVP